MFPAAKCKVVPAPVLPRSGGGGPEAPQLRRQGGDNQPVHEPVEVTGHHIGAEHMRILYSDICHLRHS